MRCLFDSLWHPMQSDEASVSYKNFFQMHVPVCMNRYVFWVLKNFRFLSGLTCASGMLRRCYVRGYYQFRSSLYIVYICKMFLQKNLFNYAKYLWGIYRWPLTILDWFGFLNLNALFIISYVMDNIALYCWSLSWFFQIIFLTLTPERIKPASLP